MGAPQLCYSGFTMRHVLSTRWWAAILLPAYCMLSLLAPRVRAAGDTVPYYNLKHAFAFAYPSDWIRLQVMGADYAVLAPDLNGVLTVTVGPGTASDTVLRKALHAAFIPFGRPAHAPALGVYALKGATAQQLQVVVKAANKRPCAITALAVSHHTRVYLILLIVQDTRQASAAADSAALETALASFALF
ncbi:MAG TPA: hypothetical protein VNL71_08485 [Chloroflexota bacterium]|nr:hypothetical protein [Chloroflexota bacterium]